MSLDVLHLGHTIVGEVGEGVRDCESSPDAVLRILIFGTIRSSSLGEVLVLFDFFLPKLILKLGLIKWDSKKVVLALRSQNGQSTKSRY